ncbi:hypothetical protein AALA44_07005 [Enterococcus ratti]|uniref:hypothetical protein n=1 Tax=Enterococcus ratti TaxID=150033 RepID=UPI003517B5A0
MDKAQLLLSLAANSYSATMKTSIQVQKVLLLRSTVKLVQVKERLAKQLIEQTKLLPEFDLYQSVRRSA